MLIALDDYGPNYHKPAPLTSSRKASYDLRESSTVVQMPQKEEAIAQREEFIPQREETDTRGEERELIIGRLVETEEFIREFEEYLQSIDEEDNRRQLKTQALANSFVLHEDKYILITVESSFQYDTQLKKNRVVFRMRFKNKTSSVLQNFQIALGQADGTLCPPTLIS